MRQKWFDLGINGLFFEVPNSARGRQIIRDNIDYNLLKLFKIVDKLVGLRHASTA